MKCFIQLSKIGDILSILPILLHEYQDTGKKPVLMVCRDFASVLAGVSYVEPALFNGAYDDLRGAIKIAKEKYSEVIVLQTHGNIPIHQTCPSFQLDQWDRGGCVKHFDHWPLLFDQRSSDREDLLLKKLEITDQPYIVFGDYSQSSPFLHKEELYQMLKDEFPDCRIIRLSEVKSKFVFDLLALFDGAAALVTVETSFLHLSKASKVPTFVLAANGWRGSAFHSKFRFYMRYSEWEQRKGNLIESLRSHKLPQIKTTVIPAVEHAYNPSICDFNGNEVVCYRVHHPKSWKTQLIFEGEPLRVPGGLQHHSIEDARLFMLNGKLHAAYVVAEQIDGRFVCYTAYGEITDDSVGHIQVHYGGNDFRGMNKNWTPFVIDGKLHFVYGIRKNNQVVIRVEADRAVSEYLSPAPLWPWGEIRGGAVIGYGHSLLRFFHSRQEYQNEQGRYFIGASVMESKPPFKTIAVSKKPIIEGDERYTHKAPHWKQKVAIPYGAVKIGGRIRLSYGRNDCECCIAELTEADLNL